MQLRGNLTSPSNGSVWQLAVIGSENTTDVEAWYFDPNGRVWLRLTDGFTQAVLAAHPPRWRGKY